MANNIYKKKDIKLDTFEDLNEKGTIASFSQGDRLSDKLVMKLSNDGVPLDLTDATQVRIDFRKPDGKLVFQYCTMEDKPQGLISAVLTTQTLAAPGKVYAEVTVQYPAGKDAVTRQFTFHVEQAIAGDKSLESTNEFPMLAKAIEAGDMLAGVDLVAIIKAGETAAAALPKAGGDMTGNLNFQTKSGAKAIQWYNDAAQLGRVVFHPSGLVEWFGKNGATENGAWNYNPTTNTFNVVAANTNVAKKADFYMDAVQANGNTKVLTAATDLNTVQAKGDYAGSGLVNAPGGDTGFWYVEVLRYSDTKYVKQVATSLTGGSVSKVFTRRMVNNVWEAWTESMQSSGGTMTGALTMQNDILFDGARQIASKSTTGQLVFGNSGVWLGDANGGGIPWQYRYSDKMFLVNSRAQLGTVDVMAHVNMSSNSQINYNQLTNTTSAKGFMFMDDGGATAAGGIGRFRNPTGEAYYMGWGASPWSAATSLTVSNSVFTYKNFAITTAEKDGTETLTVTNATQPDSNYLLQAIRRGNSVMLKGAITVDANASSLTVATLSANYRPAGGHNVRTYVTPNAGGAPAELFINGTSGAIAFNDKAKGNRIDFCITYVVN